MKRKAFIPPNWLCSVTNPLETPLRQISRFEHGVSAASVRERLVQLGLDVHSVEPYDFSIWQNKADAETARVIKEYPQARQRGEKFEFKPALWTELKDYFFRLFDNKCAYCEADTKVVSPGDVEHYRPKARVEESPLHPGYYWLAYNVENYLPACRECNASRGKKNHFPLANPSARAMEPKDDLSKELPLLVNPMFEDLGQLFRFKLTRFGDLAVCVANARTGKRKIYGETSRTIYNLNRADLIDKRGKECVLAVEDFLGNLRMLGVHKAKTAFMESLSRRQFPSACVQVVNNMRLF